jgi:translation initiation factor 2 beta subunit (eIF-2beta)/eIF-5
MTTESDRYFPLRCPACGHVTWFDKRMVCAKKGRVYRGEKKDELILKCEGCGHEMTQRVDCEGYR